jgi:hypothetical protein
MDALRRTVYACSNRGCELDIRPPDGYRWQGDERQKNVETIPIERTRRFATSL